MDVALENLALGWALVPSVAQFLSCLDAAANVNQTDHLRVDRHGLADVVARQLALRRQVLVEGRSNVLRHAVCLGNVAKNDSHPLASKSAAVVKDLVYHF